MSNLTIFNNSQFGDIRVADINGEPWFVGRDVAVALGYKNPKVALQDNVDDADKGVTKVTTSGGKQDATIINESGLYCLVFGSRLETAKSFRRWITSEVIPTIRKTGGYQMQTNKPVKMSEVFQAMAQTAKIAEDAAETANTAMKGVAALTAAQDAIDKKLDNVADVLTAPKTTEAEKWQRETHRAITAFCQENKISYRDFYDELYEKLEEQAHVNLASRVTRRQNRARFQGASWTEIRNITKLFMVSIDPKLRIIFDSLVKDFKIVYTLKA